MILEKLKQNFHGSSDEKSSSWNEIYSLKQEIQQVYQELKSELQQLEDSKFRSDRTGADQGIMDLLSQKANKDSVAQALHRKANWNEIDALLA